MLNVTIIFLSINVNYSQDDFSLFLNNLTYNQYFYISVGQEKLNTLNRK